LVPENVQVPPSTAQRVQVVDAVTAAAATTVDCEPVPFSTVVAAAACDCKVVSFPLPPPQADSNTAAAQAVDNAVT
jgi:hypothetical protein